MPLSARTCFQRAGTGLPDICCIRSTRKDHDDVDEECCPALDANATLVVAFAQLGAGGRGHYRVNRVVNPERVGVKAKVGAGTDEPLPETYVDDETTARVHAAHDFDLLGICT